MGITGLVSSKCAQPCFVCRADLGDSDHREQESFRHPFLRRNESPHQSCLCHENQKHLRRTLRPTKDKRLFVLRRFVDSQSSKCMYGIT